LLETSNNCISAANELVECLSELKLRGATDDNKIWTSLRQAVRSVWSKEKVKDMTQRLDTYRNQLALETLLLVNQKLDRSEMLDGFEFDRSKPRAGDIVEAISVVQEKLADLAADDKTEEIRTLDEAVAVVFTKRDGRTIMISTPGLILKSQGDKPDGAEEGVKVLSLQTNVFDEGKSEFSRSSVGTFGNVQHQILAMLSFNKMRDRCDEVSHAHQSTFKWVFQPPDVSQPPWSNFLSWLESGQGCYWINGKAGSGKSTLLKYIQENPATRSALARWAGRTQIITAWYFSWNLGSDLQKSRIGLYRSLLHDVLQEVPDLIPVVLPKQFRAASIREQIQFSLADLKAAMRELAKHADMSLRLCLFIDGIDEFNDDYAELAQELVQLTNSGMKMVVSSRPIAVCVDAFAEYPSLRLQDLTSDDIRSYVNDKIRNHRRWHELMLEDGREADKLVDDIIEKAGGVFLWVALVVASLVVGLRNYDRVSDLRLRVEVLPPELEDLYNHMLRKLEPIYQIQASRLFQIVLQHVETEPELRLTALNLSFADESAESNVLQDNRKLTPHQLVARSNNVEGRIRSRCCGLIEVWRDWNLDELNRMPNARVLFLHRTVVEFLRKPSVKEGLLQYTANSNFDPNISLATCFLADIKLWLLQIPELGKISFEELPWDSCRRCLQYCRRVDLAQGWRTELIIEQLDNTMSSIWNAAGGATNSNNSGMPISAFAIEMYSWTLYELMQPWQLGEINLLSYAQSTMFLLSASMGVEPYIHHICSLQRQTMPVERLQNAALAAIYSAAYVVHQSSLLDMGSSKSLFVFSSDKRKAPIEVYIRILTELISSGADPNEPIGTSEVTTWRFALAETFRMTFTPQICAWCDLLVVLIRGGAHPNANTVEKSRQLFIFRSALHIIEEKLRELSDTRLYQHMDLKDQICSKLTVVKELLRENGARNERETELDQNSYAAKRQATPVPCGRVRKQNHPLSMMSNSHLHDKSQEACDAMAARIGERRAAIVLNDSTEPNGQAQDDDDNEVRGRPSRARSPTRFSHACEFSIRSPVRWRVQNSGQDFPGITTSSRTFASGSERKTPQKEQSVIVEKLSKIFRFQPKVAAGYHDKN
jgi:hypothetical protein